MGLYQRTAHKPYIPSLFSPLMLMNGFMNCLINFKETRSIRLIRALKK